MLTCLLLLAEGVAAAVCDQARVLFYDVGLWGDPFAALDQDVRPAAQQRLEGHQAPGGIFGLDSFGFPRPATTAAGAALGAQQPAAPARTGFGATAAASTAGGFDMGRAVVESGEGVQSPQYRGLCKFVARVLRPLWDEPLFRLSGPSARVLVPMDALQAVEDRLRALEAFIRAGRKAAAGLAVLGPSAAANAGASSVGGMGVRTPLFGEAGPPTPGVSMSAGHAGGPSATGREPHPLASSLLFGGGGIAAGGLPQPVPGMAPSSVLGSKRKRADEAAKSEEAAIARLQALVGHCCEVLLLLRMAARYGVSSEGPGAPARVELEALERLRFQWLVSTSEGIGALRKVATGVLAAARGVGGERGAQLSDELRARLEDGCPSLMPPEDRARARAWALLQRARLPEAEDPDQTRWADEAVSLLAQHPRAEDLPAAVSQLSLVGAWEGLVSLIVRLAESESGGPLAPETPETRVRREAVYVHLVEVMEALGDCKPAAGQGALAGLPEAERRRARRRVLRSAAQSRDSRLLESLYRLLASSVASFPEVLDPDVEVPGMEAWLRSAALAWPEGGDPSLGLAGVVQRLELLARMAARRGRPEEAARVYERLASLPEESSGTGAVQLGLDRRVSYLEAALLQARKGQDAQLVAVEEEQLALASLQQRLAERARQMREQRAQAPGGLPVAQAQGFEVLEDSLARAPVGPTELYQIAQRLSDWEAALRVMKVCRYSGPGSLDVACALWDRILKRALADKHADTAGEPVTVQEMLGGCGLPGSPFVPPPMLSPSLSHGPQRLPVRRSSRWDPGCTRTRRCCLWCTWPVDSSTCPSGPSQRTFGVFTQRRRRRQRQRRGSRPVWWLHVPGHWTRPYVPTSSSFSTRRRCCTCPGFTSWGRWRHCCAWHGPNPRRPGPGSLRSRSHSGRSQIAEGSGQMNLQLPLPIP